MTMNSKNDNSLIIGISQVGLSNRVVVPIKVDFSSNPHLILVGNSGTGKTYLFTFLLGQIAQKFANLILADFKGIDFVEFVGCSNYYIHNSVSEAVELVFDELQSRMNNPKGKYKTLIFCVDEWSGYLSSLSSKKDVDKYKNYMASILMLGRGVGIFVIIALQRADANYIVGRDNFSNAIGLGALSKESIKMIFPNEETDTIKPKTRGHGYLRTDGKPLTEIVVPRIRDIDKTKSVIKKALSQTK